LSLCGTNIYLGDMCNYRRVGLKLFENATQISMVHILPKDKKILPKLILVSASTSSGTVRNVVEKYDTE